MRVIAPCRLHFGLFHVPVQGVDEWPDGTPIRKYGGLGMMIEEPKVVVEANLVSGAFEKVIQGTLRDRASDIYGEFKNHSKFGPVIVMQNTCVEMTANGPKEHVGFGIGTALTYSIYTVLWNMCDREYPHSWEVMSNQTSRGLRSAIGGYGYFHGGFIYDPGRTQPELLSEPKRMDFPPEWRILLVRPPVEPKWFGEAERTAFQRQRDVNEALRLTKHLEHLAQFSVIPALQSQDFRNFSRSIREFNYMAGEPFNQDQGGPYASAEVACVIDELIGMGVEGVGQSSWGPTVFAFCESQEHAEHLAAKARDRFSSETEVIISRGNNTGTKVEEF